MLVPLELLEMLPSMVRDTSAVISPCLILVVVLFDVGTLLSTVELFCRNHWDFFQFVFLLSLSSLEKLRDGVFQSPFLLLLPLSLSSNGNDDNVHHSSTNVLEVLVLKVVVVVVVVVMLIVTVIIIVLLVVTQPNSHDDLLWQNWCNKSLMIPFLLQQ